VTRRGFIEIIGGYPPGAATTVSIVTKPGSDIRDKRLYSGLDYIKQGNNKFSHFG